MNSNPSVSRRAALGGLATGLAAAAAFRPDPVEAQQSPAADKSVAELRALLQQHDKTFTSHDLDGVLKLYADGPKTVLIGTGAGELWVGKEEIKTAYQHFFQDFDPGKQDFEYGFVTGSVAGDGAWLVATGKLKLTKGSDNREIGMNASVTFTKIKGAWYIGSFHFSTAIAVGGGPQG